jgi:hypothetical protein
MLGAVKLFSEEEGSFSLIPSSSSVVCCFEQLYVNLQAQSVRLGNGALLSLNIINV